jgi:hypothetical protein
MSRLVRLYPRPWRERYEDEFLRLIQDRPPSRLERFDIVRGAIDAWLHPQVRRAAASAAHGDAGTTRVVIAAVLGGLAFAASGVSIALARIGPDGYKDNDLGVPILIGGMVLTGIAALLAATESRTLRTSWIMILGALGTLLPWPFLVIGFFTYIFATCGLGILFIARGRVVGFALLGIGLLLPSFNTENEWALAAVPVGILWIAFAMAVGWPAATSATTGPATTADVPLP